MRFYSIIIPVYNRPDELDELLASLSKQTYIAFEIIVVEDGSINRSDCVVNKWAKILKIKYIEKQNGGQGFARNAGFEQAVGDYFVMLDSDAILPNHYFEAVEKQLNTDYFDAYGGPDTAHSSFSDIQKAINYSMTSVFTTGGMRSKAKNAGGQFHPRSFNMGISRQVWQQTGGYRLTRMGEDIVFSLDILAANFFVGFIPEAYIFHKRRTTFKQFFKQLQFFGRSRINIARFYPKELKLVHAFPMIFTLFVMAIPFWWFLGYFFSSICLGISILSSVLLVAYLLLIFIDSILKNTLKIGCLSVFAAFLQLFGYGIGFMKEGYKRIFEDKKHQETGAFMAYPQ